MSAGVVVVPPDGVVDHRMGDHPGRRDERRNTWYNRDRRVVQSHVTAVTHGKQYATVLSVHVRAEMKKPDFYTRACIES